MFTLNKATNQFEPPQSRQTMIDREPMQRLSPVSKAPFSFCDYFNAIPSADFDCHDCAAGSVTYVWQHPTAHFQYVLIDSDDKNVCMVLVLDMAACQVFGHWLLDLNQAYGIGGR
jgi:hypothetical protein